ncbi:MAG: hypothetical protein ACRD21_04055 [Vicinamibacteria bacterium]
MRVGYNVQWGAPDAVAMDIAAFIQTGEPTDDLPYADPEDVARVRVEAGAANVIGKLPAKDCVAEASRLR